MKPIVKLEEYDLAKFRGQDVVVGKVYGHPRIEDGHRVITSEIVDITEDMVYITTQNTIYQLGTAKPGNANEMAQERGIIGLQSV